MTGEILHDVLGSLNRELKTKGQSALLCMDNVECHPADLAEKYSDIRVLFPLPNTTSKLCSLELGLFQVILSIITSCSCTLS